MNQRLQKVFPRVTFILGGAASGKSVHAESLVETSGKSRIYLATSQVLDTETEARIDRHRARRGPDWRLIEEPGDPAPVLARLTENDICLIDCATMWLSNRLLAGDDLGAAQAGFVRALSDCAADLVVVSGEVGQGIVPDNALARQFREAQGRLNIALADLADRVILVTAGLPQILKDGTE